MATKKESEKNPINIAVFSERMEKPIFMRHKNGSKYETMARSVRSLDQGKIPPRFDVYFPHEKSLLKEVVYINEKDDESSIFKLLRSQRGLMGYEVYKDNHQPWGYDIYTVIGENESNFLLFDLMISRYLIVQKVEFDNKYAKFSEFGVEIDSEIGVFFDSRQLALIMDKSRAEIFYTMRTSLYMKRETEFNKQLDSEFYPQHPVINEATLNNGIVVEEGDILSSNMISGVSVFTIRTLFNEIFDEKTVENYNALRASFHVESKRYHEICDQAYEHLNKTGKLSLEFLEMCKMVEL